MAGQPQLSPAQLQQVNMQARMAVLANAVQMVQQISSQSVTPSAQNILNIPPRNVGLIQGFIVEVNGTMNNPGGGAAALTQFGASNVLSNITFQDLNNQIRINTPGWHMALLNSAKQGFGYGGAYSPNLPINFGNNWTVQSAPAAPGAGADAAIRMIYYIPLAYTADDLRGAIYASVTNATMNLQLTINTTPGVAAGDATNAVYSGQAVTWKAATQVTVTVYQVYLDQIPRGQDGTVILPPLDLNTIYQLQQTTLTGMAVGTDFPYAYANYRDFLSTIAVYDNAGTLNVGSDINYWSLVSANFTQLFKYTPEIAALFARSVFMADPPKGCYYFDHRRRPINTQQFGNMELNLNASAVTAGATLLVATEAFAQIQTLQGASSLSAG